MINETINTRETINVRGLEAELKKPFAYQEIEWRIGSSFERNGEVKALALPYITSRAIMDRLDEVFGLDGWSDEYKPWGNNAQLCGITVKIGDKFVTKWDGADSTDIESVKGGLSNALKRTAVKFGIGRYLYSFDPIWVKCEVRGKSKIIAKEEFSTTLVTVYKKQLTKIYGVESANKYSGIKAVVTDYSNNQDDSPNQSDKNKGSYNNSNNNNYNSNANSNWNNDNSYQKNNVIKPNFPGNKSNSEVNSNEEMFGKKVVSNNEAQFNSESVNKPKVPGAFLNFIKSRIQATGKDINTILKYYKVRVLEELTMEQANDLVAKLG